MQLGLAGACHLSAHSLFAARRLASRTSATGGSKCFPEFLKSGARFTEAAHEAWDQVLVPGDTAVDATCGHGHDMVHIAGILGSTGMLYGFDIQREATKSTKLLLNESHQYDFKDNRGSSRNGPDVALLNQCHSTMLRCLGMVQPKLVCFNLGYLPNGRKEVTTKTDTTLKGVEDALQMVCSGGLVSVISYVGHKGGLEEYDAVHVLGKQLPPSDWVVLESSVTNRRNAPILMLMWKMPPRNEAK